MQIFRVNVSGDIPGKMNVVKECQTRPKGNNLFLIFKLIYFLSTDNKYICTGTMSCTGRQSLGLSSCRNYFCWGNYCNSETYGAIPTKKCKKEKEREVLRLLVDLYN